MFYADSLAFLAPLAKFEFADRNLKLNLAHITVAPPNVYDEWRIALWVRAVQAFIGIQRRFAPIHSREDLAEPPTEKRPTKILYGLQHPPSGGRLARLARLGVRVTTLGYEMANEYGSGFVEQARGLTPKGKALLEEASHCGIILDLSHASHRTARDALEYRERHNLKLPVMVSHTGCFDLYKHPRNLPIDVLKAIAQAGGYVGIYTLTFGLDAADNSPQAFRRHLDYALEHVGERHVGIGSDGVHKYMDRAARKAQFARMERRIVAASNFRARDPIEPEAFIRADKFQCIERFLSRQGYARTTLQRVLGESFRDFLLTALPESTAPHV